MLYKICIHGAAAAATFTKKSINQNKETQTHRHTDPQQDRSNNI